jgi:hypothetical protein
MFAMRFRALLGTLLVLAASLDASAATSTPKAYATDKTRDIVGGRKVLVLLPQTNIMATYEDVNLSAVYFMFGILAGLAASPAQAGIDRHLSQAAEERIAPLRRALEGYDFETPAKAAFLPIIEKSSWVRAQDAELNHDGSGSNIERILNESNTRQMFTVFPSYYADHKFRNLVVRIEADIIVRKIPKGQYSSARLKPDYIPFRQAFRCIVYLPGSESGTAEDNLARWSADSGRLARQALDLGIQRVSVLFGRYLDADEATVATWIKRGDRKSETRALMLGWIIEKQGDLVLFSSARDDTLNYIEILR